MTPPDDFHLATGDYLAADASWAADAAVRVEGALAGTSACGGRVTARAAVLEDVTQADRLTRGDILVTRQTDPGWSPILGLVSGLVIERGGMLSHGAIIAREFGLPCVVGVAGATARIPHGVVITVDGDRGTCALGDEGWPS
jgi:pyruvate,water dikinase